MFATGRDYDINKKLWRKFGYCGDFVWMIDGSVRSLIVGRFGKMPGQAERLGDHWVFCTKRLDYNGRQWVEVEGGKNDDNH